MLAQAAQEPSDGTAAIPQVRRLGGPAAVTARFRERRDAVTRLDRDEPDLDLAGAAHPSAAARRSGASRADSGGTSRSPPTRRWLCT